MQEMLVIILICAAIAAAIFYFSKAPQDAGGQSERKGSNERAEKNGADELPIVTQKPPEPANLCKAMDSLMNASVRNKIEKLEPVKDAPAAAREAEKKEQAAPPPQDLTNAEKPKEEPKDTSAGGILVYDHYARRIGRAEEIEASSTNTAVVPTPATSPKIDSPSKDVITAREIKSLGEALNTDGGESKDVKTCNEIKTDDVTSSKDVTTAQLIPEGGATPDAPAQAAPPPGDTSNQTPSTPSGAGTCNGEPSTPAEGEKQPEKPKKRKKKNKKSKNKSTDVEGERKSEGGEKKSKDKKKKKSKSKNKDAPVAPPQDDEKQSRPVDGQAKKVAQ